MVRPSSSVTLTVYRQHNVLSKLGNKDHYLGEVTLELQTVLTNRMPRTPPLLK